MQRLGCFVAALLLTVTVGAFAQTSSVGGLASRPRFQTVTVNGDFSAGGGSGVVALSPGGGLLRLRGTANNTTTNNAYLSLQQLGGTENGWIGYGSTTSTLHISNGIAGAAINLLPGSGGAAQVNGVPIATETSGNFTASFADACTTTPTITFGYVKIGNMVTVKVKSRSGFPCTSDSASFDDTSGAIPAALRPTTDSAMSPILGDCTDNGGGVACRLVFGTSGTVQIQRMAATFTNTSWTGSGNKSGLQNGQVFSYMLTNP